MNAILASFTVLVYQLLRRKQGKTWLSYAARRKSYENYFFSTPVASNLHLSIDWKIFLSWTHQFGSEPFFYPNCSKPSLEHRPRIFLSWKGQLILVPNIKPWPWRGQEMYLKNLALALLWNRSSSKWTTNGPCSWMSSHAARSKSPQLGWTGGKSAHTKQDSQGCPRNCSLIHY